MTANASSSSDTSRSSLHIDLMQGRLPEIPTTFLRGEAHELLQPLRFLSPGKMPFPAPPDRRRDALAQALGKANEQYGHPRSRQLAELLADPETRVVATGQQPGLLGGPLYSLSKMAAAVRWAEKLQEAGEKAIAVFWVATEDHDWQELSQTSFLTNDGPRTFDLGEDTEPLRPVGPRVLGQGSLRLIEEIAAGLPPTVAARFHASISSLRGESSFGEAFCRLMTEILGASAPLFFDPLHPLLKKLQKPWLRRMVEERDAIDTALAGAVKRLEGQGFSPQVKPQPGVSPLFLIEGDERRRIVWEEGDQYSLRGSDAAPRPVEELLRRLEKSPEQLSAGVLARPALQDAVLGTTLQVMGPSELTYLTQACAVYEVLGLDAPWTTLRPQVLFLEERHAEWLRELNLSLLELLEGEPEQILGARAEDPVAPVREQISQLLESLRGPVLEVDSTLEKPLKKTHDHILRGLDTLAAKTQAAAGRNQATWLRRLQQVRENVLPENHLQERHLSVVHFLARYGTSFIELYWTNMDLDPRFLQGIEILKEDHG